MKGFRKFREFSAAHTLCQDLVLILQNYYQSRELKAQNRIYKLFEQKFILN